MSSLCDRAGFPLVPIPSLGLSAHLFPVAKVQYERFLLEPTSFGDAWYERLLELNPRISHTRFAPENYERLLLTGVLPAETEAFARWLGPDWRVPTVEQWRDVYRAFESMACSRAYFDSLPRNQLASGAVAMIRGLFQQRRPETLVDLSLMNGGGIEWVRQADQWVGLGAPRACFAHQLCDPLRGEPVRPIHADTRIAYFGFRLIRMQADRRL